MAGDAGAWAVDAGRDRRELLRSLAIPVLYFTGVLVLVPFGERFQHSYDEGINLIKGLLCAQGHDLYIDIWSDQPPLLTLLLSKCTVWFGPSAFAARTVILALASLLLFAFYGCLRQSVKPLPAFLATLGLALSRDFMRLSVSVMVGLPALAVTMLSLYAFFRTVKRRRPGLLITSGVLFALGLQVKLFAAFLVPIVAVQLLLLSRRDARGGGRLDWIPVGLWLGSLAATTIPFILIVYADAWPQLVSAHLGAQVREAFAQRDHLHDFLQLFAYHQPVMVLMAIGVFAIARRRQITGFLPVAWFFTATLVLWLHSPIWYHHILLISIPLFWLAGHGMEFAIESLGEFPKSAGFDSLDRTGKYMGIALAGSVLVSAATLSLATDHGYHEVTRPDHPCMLQLWDDVIRYAGDTRWMWSDEPLFAYYAGLAVPPEIAVITMKRVLSGNITQERMLETLREYRPEQVLLGRFEYADDFHAYLDRHYRAAGTCGPRTHYLLNPSE